MLTVLSKVLDAAVKNRYLQFNPAHDCELKIRGRKRKHVALDWFQVQQLVTVLSESDGWQTGFSHSLREPCATIVQVAVLTGLRIGEILSLRWGRVDLEHGTLSVEESYSGRAFGPPKTESSRRTIPVSGLLRQVLEEHKSRARTTGPDDLVFSADGKKPSIVAISRTVSLTTRVIEPAFHVCRGTASVTHMRRGTGGWVRWHTTRRIFSATPV